MDADFLSLFTEAIKNDKLNELSQTLHLKKETLLSEIDTICTENYASFIEMFDHVYQLKPQLQSILAVNEELTRTAESIQNSQSSLLNQVNDRIQQAYEVIRKYRQALQIASKAKQEADSKFYFSAIKSLMDIQTDFLSVPPLVTFKYTEKFQMWIKDMLKDIQCSSFNAFSQWIDEFDNVYMEKLGISSLRLAGKRFEKVYASSDKVHTSGSNPLDWILEEGDEQNKEDMEDEFEMISRQINLTVLFECLYAHTLLDKRDAFLKSYSELRNSRFLSLLDDFRSNTNSFSMESFDKALVKFVGYFIFEYLVLANSQASFSKSAVESRWISFLSVFYEKCQLILGKETLMESDTEKEDVFMSFRNSCVTFVQCMKAYQYRFESTSALFTDLLQKYIHSQRKSFSSRVKVLIQGECLREIFCISSSSQLSSFPFIQRIIKTYQTSYVPGKATKLIRSIDSFPYEFNFSTVTVDIVKLIGELSEKIFDFLEKIPKEGTELKQLAFYSIENFITEEIVQPLTAYCNDKKSDIELLKTILHTIDALDDPVREEIKEYFHTDANLIVKTGLFLSASSKIQQTILKKIQDSVLELLPLEPDSGDEFFHYLKSVYHVKLAELPTDTKNLLFWNELNFVSFRIADSFYQDTKKGPIEGPNAPVLMHYKTILSQMHAFFEENFPSLSNQYDILFSSLRQPLDCIEYGQFYDLTTVVGRSEKLGLVDLKKFISTLDALRISNWAAKTPYSGNAKITIKSVIEDVIKKLRTELRI